jgi:hypothetical protein
MLIKERLAVPGEKNESSTILWIVALGAVALAMLAAQDFVRQNLALDVPQALFETLALMLVLVLPYALAVGITVLVASYLTWDVRRSFLLSLIVLAPQAIFMAYAHFTMSQALVPLKLNFKERIVTVKTDGRYRRACNAEGGEASPYADILAARDQLLREYGYLRLGTCQAGDDEGECHAVYLFTAGMWVNRPADPKVDLARDAF